MVGTGCDQLLGLSPISPPLDTTVDATPSICEEQATGNAPPFLCADFDEVDPSYDSNGMHFQLGTPTGPATFERRAPADSPPNALWIATGGGQYYNEVKGPSSQGTRLLATFDLEVSAFDQTSGVLFLQLNGALGNAASVVLAFETGGAHIQAHCEPVDCDNSHPVFDVLPTGWIHGQLSLDTTTSLATIHVDPNLDAEVPLTSKPFMGTPTVRFGAIDVGSGSTTPVLGIDSLLVQLE